MNDLIFPKPGLRKRYRALADSQKPPRHVPAYTRSFNRLAGRFVAAICPSWITPTTLTICSSLTSFLALALVWILPVGVGSASLAGVLLMIAYILDSADGQLARLRKASSTFGEWLDHVLDAGKLSFIHITVAAFIMKGSVTGYRRELVFVAGFLVAASLSYVGMLLSEKLRQGIVRTESGSSSWIRSIMLLPADYGVLCALFLLLPSREWFMYGYSLLSICNIAYAGAYLMKVGLEMRAIDLDKLLEEKSA